MINARRLYIAVMGSWIGLAGVEHGIGEILQGSIKVSGVMMRSWPDAPFFRSLNGEPAMTVLPNMLLTGILAVLFSLLYIIWVNFFAQRRHSGWVMILLALPMLLFGSGIFPPILAALIGTAAIQFEGQTITSQVSGTRQFAGRAWGWIFAVCCLTWLALLPGIAILDYFFAVENVVITLIIMAAAFTLLFLAYWSAAPHDQMQRSAVR